jgi:hypothetical protein
VDRPRKNSGVCSPFTLVAMAAVGVDDTFAPFWAFAGLFRGAKAKISASGVGAPKDILFSRHTYIGKL